MRRRAEFKRAYEQGRQIRGGMLTIFVFHRDDDAPPRFGFTLTRKLGNSVTRNRVRRQLRQGARELVPEVTHGRDIVVNVRREALGRKAPELQEQLRQCLQRAGALQVPAPDGKLKE